METVSLTIRIPPDLHQQLQDRAKQEDRTLASLIRVLLAQAVQDPGVSRLMPGETIFTAADVKAWREGGLQR